MYVLEFLNCPFGTRCATPTLHGLFCPLLSSVESLSDNFHDFYRDTAEALANLFVSMIQRMFEHAGLIAIGLVVYVSTEPCFVPTLLTEYTDIPLVYISRLLPLFVQVPRSALL
jgi:hypothetical protein